MNQYKPQEVGIELVKGCNFSCQMCPVPLHRDEIVWQFMPIKLVEKIVEEICKHDSVKTIWLAHLGEPLAHPNLIDCLEVISKVHNKFKRRVVLHTNGSLLNKEKAAALLETTAVTELTLSFDGFGDKESFEFLRGKHYDKVIRNISTFSLQAQSKRPDLKIATCSVMPKKSELTGWEGVFPEFQTVEENFKNLFSPLGITVQHRPMIDFSGNEELPITGTRQEKVYGGCHFVEQDSLYFTATGKAQPCCVVFNDEFNVGTIQEQNFDTLLNNNDMNSLRHDLRMDRRNNLPFCHNCSLSTGGNLTSSIFQKFWSDRHKKYPLNHDELNHVFGLISPDGINDADLLLKILQKRANQKKTSENPAPSGFIDSIHFSAGSLSVNGWAADEIDASPLTYFKICVDGQERDISDINYVIREDVANYWQKREWIFSGFKLIIENVPVGKYEVELEVKNSDGVSTFLKKMTE